MKRLAPGFLCLIALVQLGTPTSGLSARLKASKEAPAPEDGTRVEARVGSGLGVFQDVQVPINNDTNVRGDGKAAQQENQDHVGLPLLAGIGMVRRAGAMTYDFGVDAMFMRATTGPAETQSSTYSRVELGGGAELEFPLFGLMGNAGAGAGIRRSVFANVSNGHYLQSALIKGAIGVASARSDGWRLDGTFNYAPVARFGYYAGTMFGGDPFKNSKASLMEIGLETKIHLRDELWLELGFTREVAKVTIDDTTEYGGFGLAVSPERETRAYDLVTTVARVGVAKKF